MAGVKACSVAADAGLGDACGYCYLLGGAVMACIVSFSSRCGENSRFGSRDQATTAPLGVIFLKTSSRLPGKGPMFWSVGWRGAAGIGCFLGHQSHLLNAPHGGCICSHPAS
jgi:hypothetical protein